MQLRLANIQGNIAPGFRSDHQAFMLVRLPEGSRARAWLAQLRPEIATAEQVAAFQAERRRGGAAARVGSVTWINVAFSRLGLERLGVGAEAIAAFPEDFRQGLAARAEQVGDDPAQMADWEVGGTRGNEAEALVLLATRTAEDLDRAWQRQRERLEAHGGHEIRSYRGQRLPEPHRDFEHFGFRDGISQPDPAELLEGWTATEQISAPGEFILGQPDVRGDRAFVGPRWARDGSYVVFRRLRQDVFWFRQTVEQQARDHHLSPALLAAKLLGRWPSGAKLGLGLNDPGWDGPQAALLTAADFANDPEGEVCPRFAHVRKAYPRDLRSAEPARRSAEPARHRLIRRGIPYGPPLPPDARQDDGQDRGLLFLAYQASLARQFEHIQGRWFNNADFPREGDGSDPLVGQPGGPRAVRLRQGGTVSSLSLEQFVSVTAGGYFFAPSLRALDHLADPSAGWDDEEEIAMMGVRDDYGQSPQRVTIGQGQGTVTLEIRVISDGSVSHPAAPEGPYGSNPTDLHRQLGDFIRRENPYGDEIHMPSGLESRGDVEMEGIGARSNAENPFMYTDEDLSPDDQLRCTWWYFRGRPHRVTKAIMIPYTYTRKKDRKTVRAALLLGFVGAGS